MIFRTTSILFVIVMSIASASAQSVYQGKETIDKKEVSGLTLSQSIPEKHLITYWESYLEKFGKVKGKKGTNTIDKASIPAVSPNPVQVTSLVGSVSKTASRVFLSLNVDGSYITNGSDSGYKAAETVLKDFSNYAAAREEVRLADDVFSVAEKSHQKLQRDIEDKTKEIEKTEKKLNELRSEVEKGKADSQTSLLDLQNKQKALEAAKTKVPGLK
ncbi:hypothetical protein [Dyadobacter psychrotolerans]|uniref:Uncharacterized protein n=1 Tax=Dyadobacter psychrotolerans TaxID=2541721 RepID=A0A4R5DUX7_9BACT|nr:hypothetical protein [Dyadobacter psychrotolerans]TDE16314.1 hypothetical protein E0F88_08685 [Dyadobacter psychrotolerans]